MGKNQEVRKNQKFKLWDGVEWDHVTVGIFCLLSKQGQKRDKKLEVQVFLALLCFSLLEVSALGLTVGLAIGGVESIGREVTVDFFG